jgi:peptide deformylase
MADSATNSVQNEDEARQHMVEQVISLTNETAEYATTLLESFQWNLQNTLQYIESYYNSTQVEEVEPTGPPEVLLVGDPRLREVALEVALGDLKNEDFIIEQKQLISRLELFRRDYNFGRAIAAPQIGIPKRFIALNLGTGPFVMINPFITYKSEETFTMWDDCMSFPWLLVRIRRHKSISVKYLDAEGQDQVWENLEQSTSELLQHEIDHLDGILAIDLAVDKYSIVARDLYDNNREQYNQVVDFYY